MSGDLRDWLDRHAGATFVVCGCGESLNGFLHPERFVTIGVNDVGRRFTPDYLVVVNPKSQFTPERWRHVAATRAKAVFTQLEDPRIDHPQVVRFRLGRPGGTVSDEPGVLHHTRNSPYVAVGLALQMGARRIGLIGVDFTEGHFFGATGVHALTRRLARIDEEYAALAAACRARGVELVNLSSCSRLRSLPRADEAAFAAGAPAMKAPAPPHGTHPAVPAPAREPQPRSPPMKVAIETHRPGLVGDFLDALAATARALGHAVARDPRRCAFDPDVVNIVWNGRTHRARGTTLYCEHGWLPRWSYQVSAGGINADSHLAPIAWDGAPLDPQQERLLDEHLEDVRRHPPPGFQYMETFREEAAGLPAAFLLVPLQMEWDTNIVRHAPAPLRSMQGLVDAVAAAAPPWPVIFKQHPADVRRGHAQLRLRLRRAQDTIWPHARGNVYQMLKSAGCRGIVTINSNVAHDGLLWDVPAVVLGRNVWPSTGVHTPFHTGFPADWQAFADSRADATTAACRRAYAWKLKSGQWSLADAADAGRVEQLLASARRPASTPKRGVVVPVRRLPPAAHPARWTVNVAAIDKGWVFEDLKALFAAASRPDLRVVATERPLRDADAWIFPRTREAAGTPDPARTLVQIHDMFDHGLYRPGGERRAIAACAAVSLSHPDQRRILEDNGISLAARQVLERPLGWRAASRLRQALAPRFTVGWVGRPAVHFGAEVKRVEWLVEAVSGLGLDLEVVLLGERLEPAAARLHAARIACRYLVRRDYPLDRYPEAYAQLDCVAITSSTEAGPLPLFEAMACGVPVVSTRVGWAPRLIEPGETGLLVDDPASLRRALVQIADARQAWLDRREAIRGKVQGMSLASWIESNLDIAAGLARQRARGAA